MPTDFAIFDPPPEVAARVVEDLGNCFLSINDIAQSNQTSPDALSLWLARPDIAARLDAMESAAARHVRLAAVSQLPHAAVALGLAMQNYTFQATKGTFAPNSPAAQEHRRESHNVRRAAWLLYRLVNHYPGAPRPHVPGGSSPSSPAASGRAATSEAPATTDSSRSPSPAESGLGATNAAPSTTSPSTPAAVTNETRDRPHEVRAAHHVPPDPSPAHARADGDHHGPQPSISGRSPPGATGPPRLNGRA